MKSVKNKILSILLVALFAILASIAGAFIIGGNSYASAEAETQTQTDGGDVLIAPDGASSYAQITRPAFYTGSLDDKGALKFTAVPGGVYTTAFTYSTTDAHYVQLQGYDPATMSYTLTQGTSTANSSWMTAVEDAENKTLTVTILNEAPATTNASLFKITVTPQDGNAWVGGATNGQEYSVSVKKLQVETPKFYQIVSTEGDDGSVSTEEVQVPSLLNVPYSPTEPYKFVIKGYDAKVFKITTNTGVNYELNETGDEIKVTYPAGVATTANPNYRYLRLTLLDASSMEWKDGTDGASRDFQVTYVQKEVEVPVIAGADAGSDSHEITLTYSGALQTVVFTPAYSGELNFTCTPAATSPAFDAEDGTYKAHFLNANTYTVTVSLASTVNYKWKDSVTPNVTYRINVKKGIIPNNAITLNYYGHDSGRTTVSEVIPDSGNSIAFAHTIEYWYVDFYYSLVGVNSGMISVGSFTTSSYCGLKANGFDVPTQRYHFYLDSYYNGTYNNPVREHNFPITPTANYTWADGTSDARTVIITVTKKSIEVPKIVNGEVPTDGSTVSEQGVRSNNDTEISFYYTGANQYAYLDNYIVGGDGAQVITHYSSSPSSNRWGNTTYLSETHYSIYSSAVGVYTINVQLANTNWYQWKDAAENHAAYRTYKIHIIAKPVDKLEDFKFATYGTDNSYSSANRQEIKLRMDGVNAHYEMEHPGVENIYFSIEGIKGDYLTIAVSNANYLLNGTLANGNADYHFNVATGTTVASHYISLTPKAGYSWSNGTSTARYIYIDVIKRKVAVPVLTDTDKLNGAAISSSGNTTVVHYTYDGAYHPVWVSGYQPSTIITATQTYGAVGGTTGKEIINSHNDEENDTSGMYSWSGKSAGQYIYTFTLKDTAKFEWADNGAASRVITLQINKKQINLTNHDLYYYGSDTAYAEASKGTKPLLSGEFGATMSVGVPYYSDYSYYNFAFEGLRDTTLGEDLVTVAINNSNSTYNTSFMQTVSNADNNTGEQWRFRIYRYSDTGRGGIIRACYINFTPTANYCWDASGTNEARLVTVSITKRELNIPVVDSLIGDGTDSEDNPTNIYNGSYDANSRTATFTYGDGDAVGMNLVGYDALISRTAAGTTATVVNTANGYTFTAVNAGTNYTLTMSINTTYYLWDDGTNTNKIFTIIINKAKTALPSLIYTDNAYGTAEKDGAIQTAPNTLVVDYRNTENHFFNILGYDASKMSISVTNSSSLALAGGANTAYSGYIVQITQTSGNRLTGTLVYTVSPDANHVWDVTDGSETTARQYTITVRGTVIDLPEFVNGDAGFDGTRISITYDGTQQVVTLDKALQTNFDIAITAPSGVTSGYTYEWKPSLKQYDFKLTNAGTYTLTLTLKANVQWDDAANATSTRTYTVVMQRKEISAPEIVYFGNDSAYGAANVISRSGNGSIYITYNPNFSYHYLTLQGTYAKSSYFTIDLKGESSNYIGATWDNGNNRNKLYVRQYDTNLTRAAGWSFYLTPTANYCWETSSSTVDISQRAFTVFVNKLEIALPRVYEENDGGNYVNGYKYVTYNTQNQRLAFLNYDDANITGTVNNSGTQTVTTEDIGEDKGVAVKNFWGMNALDYTITLSLKNTYYYMWANNSANPVYHLVIERAKVSVPEFYRVIDDSPVTDADDPNYINQVTKQVSVSYSTIEAYYFVLQNYQGTQFYSVSYSHNTSYIKRSTSGTNLNFNLVPGIGRADYTVTLALNSNYMWSDGSGWDNKVYTVTVDRVQISLLSIYDSANNTSISSTNQYSVPYDGAYKNIVWIPTISDITDYHFNFSPEIFAVYNNGTGTSNVAGNATYKVSPTSGNPVTIDGVTVNSMFMSAVNAGTYRYWICLANDNYIWENGQAYNTYKTFDLIITPKEIPRLEYYYNDELKNDNVVTEEYSRDTRTVYVVVPKGSNAQLSDYVINLRSTSYFSASSQTTYDGRDAYLVTVAAFAPADYYFTVNTANTNIMWTGEGVRTESQYHFVVTKKIIAEPVLNLIESAATEEDPTATKDTPISTGHSVEYTGQYYRIKFTGAHSSEVSIGNVSGAPAFSTDASTGASWSNATQECIRTARDANTYTIRVSVRNENLYQWASGQTYRDYAFTINRKQVASPSYTFTGAAYDSSSVTPVDGDTYSTVYNGANQFFKLTVEETAAITSFDTGTSNSSYRLTSNNSQWAVDKYYYFYQANVSDYTVTVNLNGNYCWVGGSTDPLIYHFNITRQEVAAPEFDEQWLIDNGFTYTLNGDTLSVVYCNKGITAHIKGFDTSMVKNDYWWHPNNNRNNSAYRPTTNSTDKWIAFNSNCSWVNNASYPYKIQIDLLDTNNYQWVGGGTTALVFNMHIVKQDVIVPDLWLVEKSEAEGGATVETLTQYASGQIDNLVYRPEGWDIRIKDVDHAQVKFSASGTNLTNGGSITGADLNVNWATGSTEGNYHFTTAGTYKITVSLNNTSYYQWYGSTNTDAKVYTIIINRKEISLPQLEDGVTQPNGSFVKTVVYNGNPQTLKILTDSADFLIRTGGTNYSALGDPDRTTPGCILYSGAVNAGTYSIILGFNNTGNANLNYVYANETQAQTFTLTITPKPIDVPYIMTADGLGDSGTVDGAIKTVIYTPDSAGRSMLVRGYDPNEMTFSWNGTTSGTYVDDELSELILKVTAQTSTTYTLTFSVTSNYQWNTTGGADKANKELKLQITKRPVSVPTFTITDGADYVSTVTTSTTRTDINFTYNNAAQGFNVTFIENVELGVSAPSVTHTPAADNLHTYTATNAGQYYVRFNIANPTNYMWGDGNSDIYRYIYINIGARSVDIPTLVVNDDYADSTSSWSGSYKYVEYTGTSRYIVIDNYNSNLSSYTYPGLTVFTNADAPGDSDGDTAPKKNYLTLFATDAKTYVITFTLTSKSNYKWATNTTADQCLYLVINPKSVDIPTITEDSDKATATYDHSKGVKTVTYNGYAQSIKVNVSYGMVNTPTYTSGMSVKEDQNWITGNEIEYQATNAGTYTITFKLSNANYKWKDGTTADKTLQFVVNKMRVTRPVIINEDLGDNGTIVGNTKTVEYNAAAQYMNISAPFEYVTLTTYNAPGRDTDDNWKKDNVLNIWATDVNTYTFRFTLKSTNNLEWDNQTNAYIDIIFKVDVKRLNIPQIEGYGSNMTQTVSYATDADGNPVTQYMYLTNIVDENIIKVTASTIYSNTTYGTYRLEWSYDAENKRYVCSANNVFFTTSINNYSITLGLVNSNYRWTDGTTTAKTYNLRIERKAIDLPAFYEVSSGKDENGKDTEVLTSVNSGKAIFEYDGKEKTVRLVGIPNNIVRYADNSVSTSTGTYSDKNGDLLESYDAKTGSLTYKATHVFLDYRNYTKDYTITLTLTNTKNYVWNDGQNGTGAKYFYIRINRKQITLPRIEGNTGSNMYYLDMPFSNNPQSFTLLDVDQSWMTATSNNPTNFPIEYKDGNKLLGSAEKDVRDNYVTLALKDTLNTSWTTSSNYDVGNKAYHLRIQTVKMVLPSVVGNNTQKYTSEKYTFQYRDVWGADYMTYTLSDIKNMTASLDEENKILTVTVAANAPITSYYVTFVLKNYSNMQWNTSNATSNKSVYIYLQKAQVAIPSIADNGTSLKKTVSYNGKDQTIALENYLRDMNADGTAKWMTYTIRSTAKFNGNAGVWNAENETMDFSAQNVATYVVRVSTNSFCTFTDGSTYKDYTLEITKAVYDSPFFVDDGVGTTTAYVKTFTFNFGLQSAVMKNVINDVNINDQIVWWRDITGYGSGTADDHRLKIEWNKDSQTATISAQYIGTYYVRFQIADNAWANARWSTTTSNYIDYRIVVNRAVLTVPSVVKTGLAANESISGRYKYSTYSGSFVIAQFKDVDAAYMTWQDLTNYTGKDDDHKAVFSYDSDTKVLTLKAKYVATYTFRVRLKDFNNTYWSGYSAGRDYTFDCGLVINKFNHAYPTVASGVSTSVTYTGEDVNFTLQNVIQGTDKYEVTQGSMKEVSWDQGFLTLSAKDVGTYKVVVSIIDTDNSSWTRYSSLTFTFAINRKALSAELNFSSPVTEVNEAIRNGSSSWASGVPVFLNVNINGLNPVEGESVGLNAYWYNNNNTSVTTALTASGTNRYTIPTTLTKGTYYVVVAHSATADNYTLGTYKLKFVINSDPARFTENDLVWQYSAGSGSKVTVSGSHNTAGTALDLTYAGEAYQFSITLSDAELQKLNVRLVSYDGATTATDYNADVYCVSVTIAAYDSSYYFPKTTYNLYYRINKAKFNLSQVKWDYSDPFTYDGTAKNVEIYGASLPAGLTVASYTGSRSMTDATEGKARGYTTGVTFTVASQNYIVPIQSDPDTYTGNFSWTCEWQINKAPIDVQWKPIVKVDEDNMIFNIPVLIDGGEKVTYSYEKWITDSSYEEGGYWRKVEKVTYSTEEVTYRVTPKLTDGTFNTVNYAANYKLVPSEDETVAHEFTVGGEQIPVMFKVLINGKTGVQFPYTGSAYVATVTVEQDDEERITVVEDSVRVTYTRMSDGTNLGSAAPSAVGRYKVTITLSYNIKSAGESANINSKVEEEFEIVKGTLDTSMLVWKIDHTGGHGKCTYDAAQGKWIDIYGAEVDKFVYDGNPYTLTLEGVDKLYGLMISGFTGLTGTDKGDYQAKFVMTYDANSWEAPDFSNVLNWSIEVAEIRLDTAYWNYGDAFVYSLEDGNAVTRTVELSGLPVQLADMIKAGTAVISYTGNTGSAAGSYTAKATITLTNPNYIVVYPETLKDTLTWKIEQRKLIIPEAGNKWTEFDGRKHDLLAEVCGADTDWADYYDVSIRYSLDGTTYMRYNGYNGVATDAYNAYFYELTLTVKDTVNTRTATNAVWENESADKQIVSFSIGKLTVTVTGWNGDRENTTALTDHDSIVKPDMLGYTITDADGKEYTKEEAKQLGGGITLTVKPYVVSAFANNVTLAYVDENSKSFEYVTEYVGLEWLAYPELKADSADYNGTEHTFEIADWDYYSDYLEFTSITDDEGNTFESASLRQTKAGTYTVYLKIKNTANASWKTTDGSIDRSRIIELSFTINIKMVKLPSVSDYEFTGSVINLANVLDAELIGFVNLGGAVSATNAGKYELTLAFKDAASCVWNDGTSDEKTISWNINQKVLSTPDAGGWTVFDGEVHNLVKDCGYGDDWNTFFDVSVEYSVDGEEFEEFAGYEADRNYTAYKSGVYRIVFTIKEALNSAKENVVWSNYTTEAQTATVAVSNYGVTVSGWNANREQSTVKLADGTTASAKFFEYIIRNSETQEIVTPDEVLTAGVGKGFTIELAVKSAYEDYVNVTYSNDSYRTYFFTTEKLLIDKPVMRFTSYEFNGAERTFEIVDWATKYAKYLEMNRPAEYLKQTAAGNYEIVVSFKENSVAAWSDGSTDAYTLKFSITEKEIVKPAVTNVGYTGSEINILTQYVVDNGTDYIEVKSGDKGTNAGNYTLVIGLKYPESTKWQGGDNSDLSINWAITQTKLITPANNEKWTVFDAQNHDLLSLCGVQNDWSNYYTVNIEYSADGGVSYGAFGGSFGYNAGSYKLTFSIKEELNPDGASNVVWARTENTGDIEVVIQVGKLEVNVIGWNENANDSTVKLESGVLPASIASYVFKDADGKQVDEADVLAAAKGVKFSKELVISDADNVTVNYEAASLKRYYFVMAVHKMYVPAMSETSVVYDGKSHTFIINDWDLYEQYVEIITAESSSLTQQDAGEFSVKLHIKDTMVSTWQDGSTDDVIITFAITKITVDGRWDTKNLPNTFVVTGTYPADNNALVTVTYTDKDGKTADVDSLKEGETYTATVAISRSYTVNYALDENIELSVTFTMPINYERLNLPAIRDAIRPYNGKAQTFQIGFWANTYADYLDIEGSLTQTDAGKYEVTLTFKEGVHATWQDGSTDGVTLKFEITGVTVSASWDISGEAPVLDTADTEYAGGSLPEDLIGYVFKDDKGAAVEAGELVPDVNYYVTASISADYRRNFSFASDVQKVYVFYISDGRIVPATLKKLSKPELIGNIKQYTGAELTFEIENWDTVYKSYLDIVEGSLTQTDAGEYSVTLRFKDGVAAIWESGGMEDVVLKFTVTAKVLDGEWIFEEDGLEQPYLSLKEDGFGLPEGLLEYVIKDADGNVITTIKSNVTYYITVSVSDANYTLAKDVETEKVFRLNTDNTFTEVIVKRMPLPEFVQSSVIYDGSAHVFEIVGFDDISSFVEVTGDSLTQTNVGKYKVTFHIKDSTVATWEGGSTGDYTLSFEITARTTALPVDMPAMVEDTLVYTGSEITFEIEGWVEKYQDIIELSGDALTQTEVGKYSVTLKIKDTSLFIWENGKLDDITLTFEIIKAEVDGEWKLGDDVPYFAPDESGFGVYPEGMIEYTITDRDGNVVDFRHTETCVTYYMTATVVNGNFEFADGVQTTFAFRYTEGNVLFAVEVQLLEFPEFVLDETEYDGEEHTFEVKDWEYLGQYLEMNGASLTQTKVGEYSVTFSITDTTLATWKNGTTRTFSLRFRIVERTSGTEELKLPVIENAEVVYDGTAHAFVIEGWEELADKVELGGDGLTQTSVGTYTATLRIKNSVLYVWADGSDTATVSFTVKAVSLKAEWVFDNTDVPYVSFVAQGAYSARNGASAYDGISDIVRYEITDYNGNVISANDTVSGVNYYITAVITDPNYTFEEGFENRFVYRISTDGEIVPVVKTTIGEVRFVVDAIQYDGEAHTFEIENWATLEPYMQIIGSLTKTNIGEYRVTLHIIDKTLATWDNGTALDRAITFRITEDSPVKEQLKFERPSIVNKSQTYDGSSKTFAITNWSVLQDYIEILEGVGKLTQTATGTYRITLHIIDPENVKWDDGSTDDFTLIFKIDKFELNGAWNNIGKIPAIDFNEKDYLLTLPENIIESVITDRTGAVVNPDSLEKGETYLITYTVNKEYADSYFLPTSLRSSYFKVSDGVSEPVDGFPAEKDTVESDNTLIKVVLAVVIILVLFLVTIIICFIYIVVARKKKAKQDAEDEEKSEEEAAGENAATDAEDVQATEEENQVTENSGESTEEEPAQDNE